MYHRGFDKDDSTLLKGCAILMMLFHHLFLSKSRFKGYEISFAPFSMNFVVNVAYMFKFAMGLYAFISGYGLLLSFQNLTDRKSITRNTKRRLLKLFFSFLFCYVICFIASMCIDRYPLQVYFKRNVLEGVIYLILDTLGLSDLFGTPTLISSWWYMSAAIMFIILAPMIISGTKKTGYLPACFLCIALPRLIGNGFPGGTNPWSVLLPYLLGMIAADYSVFDKIDAFLSSKKFGFWAVLAFCLLGMALSYGVSTMVKRKEVWELHFGLLTIPWILFCNYILGSISFLRKPLIFLGKHSMNIYFTHTFIRSRYGNSLVYSRGHFVMVFLTLLFLSLLLSIFIESFKKVLRYDKFTKSIIERI